LRRSGSKLILFPLERGPNDPPAGAGRQPKHA
jgi:hypothetical protein